MPWTKASISRASSTLQPTSAGAATGAGAGCMPSARIISCSSQRRISGGAALISSIDRVIPAISLSLSCRRLMAHRLACRIDPDQTQVRG
jgi:hypothetical protein